MGEELFAGKSLKRRSSGTPGRAPDNWRLASPLAQQAFAVELPPRLRKPLRTKGTKRGTGELGATAPQTPDPRALSPARRVTKS